MKSLFWSCLNSWRVGGNHTVVNVMKTGEQCRSGLLFPIDFFSFLCSLVHAKNIFNILTSALLWNMARLCFVFSCVILPLHFVPFALFSWDVKSFSFVSFRPNCLDSRTALCTTWKKLFLLFCLKTNPRLYVGEYGLWKCLLVGREEQKIG